MFSRLVKNRTEPIVYGICGVATVKCKKKERKKHKRERKEGNTTLFLSLGSLCCVFEFVSFGTRTRCVLDIKKPKENLMLSIKENKNKEQQHKYEYITITLNYKRKQNRNERK